MHTKLSCSKIMTMIVALAIALFCASCDGPFPHRTGGDDGWPLTGVVTADANSVDYQGVLVVKADDTLWSKSHKLMDDVKSVYWAGGSGRILTHTLDGSLWFGTEKLMDDVSFVSMGSYMTLVIKTDGSLWEFRSDEQSLNSGFPFLNEGDYMNGPGDLLPPVYAMDGVKFASAGDFHALAIKEDDSLWMWGYRPQEHEPGVAYRNTKMDGIIFTHPEPYYDGGVEYSVSERVGIHYTDPEPVKIMDNIVYASAGADYSMAVDNEGVLWAWGSNGEHWKRVGDSFGVGRLGDGTGEDRDLPVKIMEDVRLVSTSFYDTMAVKTDGSLWYWGGIPAYLNDNKIINETLSPVKIWDDETLRVSLGGCGYNHSGAIKADGSFWEIVSTSVKDELWPCNEFIQFTDDLCMVKLMEDVLYEHLGVVVRKDGSLWQGVGSFYPTDDIGPVMIFPPGTVRIEQ